MYNFYIDWGYIKYKSFLSVDDTISKNGVFYKTGVIYESMYVLSYIINNYNVNNIYLCLDGIPVKQELINEEYKASRDHEKSNNYLLVDDVQLAYQYANIPFVNVAYSQYMEADETIKFLLDIEDKEDIVKVIYSKDHDLKQFIDNSKSIYLTDGLVNKSGNGYILQDNKYVEKNGVKGIKG